MKVTEHLTNANNKILFSIEILPPLKGENISILFDNIDPLMEFKPPFIDVTYHREEYVYKKKENGLLEKFSTRKRPGTKLLRIHHGDIPAALNRGICFINGNQTYKLTGLLVFTQIQRHK